MDNRNMVSASPTSAREDRSMVRDRVSALENVALVTEQVIAQLERRLEFVTDPLPIQASTSKPAYDPELSPMVTSRLEVLIARFQSQSEALRMLLDRIHV